jgi:hypothetical protein
VSFRDLVYRLLDRGAAVDADPDEIIEIACLRLVNGPMAVAVLRDNGIAAQGIESYSLVTEVRGDYRILVARRDAERALMLLEDLR